MKLKKFSIICATLACLTLRSNVFAEEQQSFIRKVENGGHISQSIQTRDGSYAYMNGRSWNRSTFTKVNDPSRKRISEVSLTFEGPYWSIVTLRGMAQTLDGFVLVGMEENYYYGPTNGIVLKVSMGGQVFWNKRISVDESVGFDSVIPTADGGFIVTGWVTPVDKHPILIKFSSGGDVLWSKSFDTLSPFFQSTPTLDGGVILAADLIRNDGKSGGADVIKMDGAGNLVWAVTLEMKEFSLQSLTALSDHGYLLAGRANNPNKLLIVRLNADGKFNSNAAYLLKVRNFTVSSLAQTPDRGIAVGGDLGKDGFLLKINDRQELTFQKRLRFAKYSTSITSVFIKEDGSYLLLGSTGLDTLFVRLNSDGLATGCNFSLNLSASKLLFENVKHKSLAITPNSLVVPPGESFNVTSKRLTREISNVCAN